VSLNKVAWKSNGKNLASEMPAINITDDVGLESPTKNPLNPKYEAEPTM
jgi:hypothetical protein